MADRQLLLRTLPILALLCASGCGTIHHWEQEHSAAVERRDRQEAAQDAAKADRAQKLKLAQNTARLRQLQSELVAHGDPDSLAASALVEVSVTGFTVAALEPAVRAVAAAPDRADLALVEMQLCESTDGCDPGPMEARLLRLDPDNGITWTYVLMRADRDHRPADWEVARANLAQAKRIDLYWNRTVSRLAKQVNGKAGFDAGAAVIEVIGIEAALITALQPVSHACQTQEIQRPEALEQCRRIAEAFRHGDTALIEAYGSSLALNLWPDGSAEKLAVLAERRALRYRVDLTTRHAKELNSPQATNALPALLAQYSTEQTAFRALYIRLGLQPDPPEGWVDPKPGS
jgi:hypothetical protein